MVKWKPVSLLGSICFGYFVHLLGVITHYTHNKILYIYIIYLNAFHLDEHFLWLSISRFIFVFTLHFFFILPQVHFVIKLALLMLQF